MALPSLDFDAELVPGVPEIIIVSDAVEGTFVNLDGEKEK